VTVLNVQQESHKFVDKRPLLQAFLVATVHDLTGYRSYNSIYLNVFLTPFSLLLIYVIGQRMGGISVGVMASLLLATLPLFSYMSAGGGMETVNVLFILTAWFLGGLYLERPTQMRLGAFALSGVLLAQARYESVLFILPVSCIIIWSWLRDKKLSLPWPLLISPLLLIPYLWQYQVFRANANMWQLNDVEGAKAIFGTQFIPDNFGRAIGFFFDVAKDVPNSWLLSAVGIFCVLLLAVSTLLRWREFRSQSSWLQVFIIMLGGFVVLLLLLLSYAWKFDMPVIVRLTLPLHLPMAIAAAYVLFHVIKHRYAHRVFALGFLVYVMVYALPVTSEREYSLNSVATKDFLAAETFLKEQQGKHMMFIADNSCFFLLFNQDAISTAIANHRKDAFKFFLSYPLSPPVYYFQRLKYDPAEKKFRPASKGRLSDDFVMEVYWEKVINESYKVRMMRVIDIKGIELEELEFDDESEYMRHWARNVP